MEGFEELAGGLIVPAPAYNLILDLTNRGLQFTQDGDRLRVSGPGGAKPELSDAEATAIRKWKYHLMQLLAYRAPEA